MPFAGLWMCYKKKKKIGFKKKIQLKILTTNQIIKPYNNIEDEIHAQQKS